jgi:hypothetical protein
MPSEQENYRREQFEDNLQETAIDSSRLRNKMQNALSAYQRDKSMIDARLADSNLTDKDFLHNGARSITIGEAKKALRTVLSYAVHAGDLSEPEATSLMTDAGISDNTIVPTSDIASNLKPLRV